MNKGEIIEKYIQNRLSPEEKVHFDELMKTDASFKEAVAWQIDVKKAVAHEDESNFRKLLEQIESKSTKSRSHFIKWMAAASVLLLISIGFYYYSDNNTRTSDDLFADYFEPYRNVIEPIERGDIQQNDKTVAFKAYESGDFKKAEQLFTKLYEATNESYYLFYKANALLKLNKAKEAIPVLLQHLKTKDTLTEKTDWYLALAYLKVNNKENAKRSLKKVIANGSYKVKEANELLEKID